MTKIADIIHRSMLRRLSLEKAVELIRAARKAGHTAGCECRTVDAAKSKQTGLPQRWGCRELRRKLLGSPTRYMVVYE